MTRNKSSLHQLDGRLRRRRGTSRAQSGLVRLQDSLPGTFRRRCDASSSAVHVEAKSYDPGSPVSLQYGSSRPKPQSLALGLDPWNAAISTLSVEPEQASSYEVEPFALQQDWRTEQTQQPHSFQAQPPSGSEMDTSVEDYTPISFGAEPKRASVSGGPSLAEDFSANIDTIVKQAKDQNSPAIRSGTAPPQSQTAEPQQQEQGQVEPAPQQPYSHAVFDELAQGMQYATTFDMGSVDLSATFDAFDRALDREEALQAARDRRGALTTLSRGLDLDEATVAEDLSAIAMQSPAVGKSPSAVGSCGTQPTQAMDLPDTRPRAPKPPAIATMTYAEPFGPAPGTNPGSTQANALKEIDKFATAKDSGAAFKLSRTDVISRLTELIKDPSLVQQGRLNLCGPAVFFYFLLQRDPVTFSKYVASLFTTGRGSLGSMTISPDDDLKSQGYDAAWGSPVTDWMAMSALRDDQNLLLDYEGTPEENASAATSPAEMRNWLKATGLYSKVKSDANWMVTKNVDHAKALNPQKKSTDVVLLINAHILSAASASNKKSDEFILSAFPNHYVGLETPVVEKDGQVQFTCWSWGGLYTVAIPTETFRANYYGAVIADK